MSNLSQFLGGGGGGLTPKFQEFTSSGTFTPSQALIDAGGYIEVFLVAGGGANSGNDYGAAGGETFIKAMYLTTTSSISVTIGAGGTANGGNGGNSSFNGSSAGGTDLTAKGGGQNGSQDQQLGATFGAYASTFGQAGGSGMLGYGGGAMTRFYPGGVYRAKANSGQAGYATLGGGSGYCLVKWYE